MEGPVVPFDVARMVFGEDPAGFYLEIFVRTVIVYGYTLLLIRWIGGRSVAQLSMVEFLLVIALGSAVGDALFYPDVPLLHALAAITLVVLINKALDLAIARWDAVKFRIDGGPSELIVEGRVILESLARRDMGMSELTEELRLNGVRNFGEIEHAYIESGGSISVFRFETPRPGFAIVPPPSLSPPPRLRDPHAAEAACCLSCGAVAAGRDLGPEAACPHCGGRRWVSPVLPEAREKDHAA